MRFNKFLRQKPTWRWCLQKHQREYLVLVNFPSSHWQGYLNKLQATVFLFRRGYSIGHPRTVSDSFFLTAYLKVGKREGTGQAFLSDSFKRASSEVRGWHGENGGQGRTRQTTQCCPSSDSVFRFTKICNDSAKKYLSLLSLQAIVFFKKHAH